MSVTKTIQIRKGKKAKYTVSAPGYATVVGETDAMTGDKTIDIKLEVSYDQCLAVWNGGTIDATIDGTSYTGLSSPLVKSTYGDNPVMTSITWNNSAVETLDYIDTENVETLVISECPNLTTIPLLDCGAVTSISTSSLPSLTTIEGFKDLGKNFATGQTLDLSSCPLTYQSALNVISNLYTVDSSLECKVLFSDDTLSYLSDSDLQDLVDKGWRFNPITVSFDVDGGSSVDSKEVYWGYAYGELPTSTKTNYVLSGWYDSDGNEITSTTIVSRDSNHTLTAHWKGKAITVSFDVDGGSSVEPITVYYGETYGELPISTKTGYYFSGWYDSSGERIYGTTVVIATEDTQKLTAHWTVKTVEVSFDSNGGTPTPSSITVTFDSSYGELPAVSRTEYDFLGWYDSDGNEITSESIVKIEDNHTLTAYWKSVSDLLASWTGGTLYRALINGTVYKELSSPILKSTYGDNPVMTEISWAKEEGYDTDLKSVDFIDGSNLNTAYEMFGLAGNRGLTSVALFDTIKVKSMYGMFGNCTSLTSVPQFDTRNVTDMVLMFYGCSSLTSVPEFNTSKVTRMISMFANCTSLTSVPLYNTSNVTDMSNMFVGCHSLPTVPLFDARNVTDMDSMFFGCTSLTSVPEFNTSKVTDMAGMFYKCSSLPTVPLFDTSNVTDMSSMFRNCTSLTSVPQFDTSSVTDMERVFWQCTSLTSVPLFDTSKVTNMFEMFEGCSSLPTVPLFDTSNVTNMENMFGGCSSLPTVPLFDTSNVTNMEDMFVGCTSLTSVPLFDTSNVTDMSSMFRNCPSLKSVPLFDTSSVINMVYMFDRCTSITSVPQFDTSKVKTMYGMFYNCTSLTTVPELDTSNVTSVSYINGMFEGCISLTDLGRLQSLGKSFTSAQTLDLSDCPLTHQSALNVLDGLYSVSISDCTVKFSSSTYNTLTSSEIAIGTGKGWTITSA